MPIYQTKMTKEILAQIEDVSEVTWNRGHFPTEYWSDKYCGCLNISEDALSLPGMYANAMCLWESEQKEDRWQCTAEEFVEHCKRMMPK
jgi:hypothetical protein